MTETMNGAASAAPALPPLDTPEARWAYVLTLWHSLSLTTPERISVIDDCIHVRVNNRAAVDAWGVAMSCQPPAVDDDGQYQARSRWSSGECYRRAFCDLEPTGATPMAPELAQAIDGVLAILADEPNLVCNKQIAVEQHCALNAGHDGDCDPAVKSGPQLASAWQNDDGTIGQECVCGVTLDGFDRADREVLYGLFTRHVCNTLPPPCGYILGCNLGPDDTAAAADDSGLCVQHRAEVYPDMPAHGPASTSTTAESVIHRIVCYCATTFDGDNVQERFDAHLASACTAVEAGGTGGE